MPRNYNFEKTPTKNRDSKIIGFCIVFIFACIMCTYMYCSGLKADTNGLQNEQSVDSSEEITENSLETVTQQAGTDDGLPSSVSTMLEAGNYCADMQNEMIAENDEYLLEVKNAIAAGYYERIIMSDRYQELIKTFDKKYMRDIPTGASTVMWSEYGVWEFNADYDYSTELNTTMPAVWTCYDKSDTEKRHPYAFVTATYITSTGQFIEPRLAKTEWYPDHSSLYEGVDDEGIVADQCGDMDAIGGGNEEANMTDEQLEAWQTLQKLMAGEAVKEDAVTISH